MKIDDAKTRSPGEGIHRKKEEASLNARFSLYSQSNREELSYVDINKIIPFKNQARTYFDDESIDRLSESISKHGLRAPLTLIRSKKDEGLFEVVSGERRLKACKKLGFSKVHAFILADESNVEDIALIENIQREDLHPIEFGKACEAILNKGLCHSTKELAEKLGVARTRIAESIALLDLPSQIQIYLIKNKITNRDIFRRLRKVGSLEKCEEVLGIKEAFHETKSTSILRFFLKDGNIMVQKGKLSSLNERMKLKLKEEILEVLSDL